MMICPACQKYTMSLYSGEDKTLNGDRYGYSYFYCRKCQHTIRDHEDEFNWNEKELAEKQQAYALTLSTKR